MCLLFYSKRHTDFLTNPILMDTNIKFCIIFTCPEIVLWFFFLIIHSWFSSCTKCLQARFDPQEAGCLAPALRRCAWTTPVLACTPAQPVLPQAAPKHSPTFISRQTLHLVTTWIFTVPRFDGVHSTDRIGVVVLFICREQIHILFTWDKLVRLVDLHW